MEDNASTIRVYRSTLLALLALTVLTVYTGKFAPPGLGSIAGVIIIASLKAGLVAAFFMHLRFESRLIIAVCLYPLVVLSLLIGGTYLDVATRTKEASPAAAGEEQIPQQRSGAASPGPSH